MVKQTLTYFSKTIAPQLLSGTNAHYGQNIQGIRVVDLAVKLGKIKSTYINEQHFDLVDEDHPETYNSMTIPDGNYDTAEDWGVAFAQIYSTATSTTTTCAIDETNTRLIFTSDSNKYSIQRVEPVVIKGHCAYVSFSANISEMPSSIMIKCPIPDGTYTPKSYASALESALNVSQPGNDHETYAVAYDRALNRITISLSSTTDNNRYVSFNKVASEYVGFPYGKFLIYKRFGGASHLQVLPLQPKQLNDETPDLSVMGWPFGVNRGKIGIFDKPFISIDGAYDAVLLCSNALRPFGMLMNGTNSNCLVTLPTMGVILDWVKCDYSHRAWHQPTAPIDYNSLDFYITDASGHVFEDARFIVTLEIQ